MLANMEKERLPDDRASTVDRKYVLCILCGALQIIAAIQTWLGNGTAPSAFGPANSLSIMSGKCRDSQV